MNILRIWNEALKIADGTLSTDLNITQPVGAGYAAGMEAFDFVSEGDDNVVLQKYDVGLATDRKGLVKDRITIWTKDQDSMQKLLSVTKRCKAYTKEYKRTRDFRFATICEAKRPEEAAQTPAVLSKSRYALIEDIIVTKLTSGGSDPKLVYDIELVRKPYWWYGHPLDSHADSGWTDLINPRVHSNLNNGSTANYEFRVALSEARGPYPEASAPTHDVRFRFGGSSATLNATDLGILVGYADETLMISDTDTPSNELHIEQWTYKAELHTASSTVPMNHGGAGPFNENVAFGVSTPSVAADATTPQVMGSIIEGFTAAILQADRAYNFTVGRRLNYLGSMDVWLPYVLTRAATVTEYEPGAIATVNYQGTGTGVQSLFKRPLERTGEDDQNNNWNTVSLGTVDLSRDLRSLPEFPSVIQEGVTQNYLSVTIDFNDLFFDEPLGGANAVYCYATMPILVPSDWGSFYVGPPASGGVIGSSINGADNDQASVVVDSSVEAVRGFNRGSMAYLSKVFQGSHIRIPSDRAGAFTFAFFTPFNPDSIVDPGKGITPILPDNATTFETSFETASANPGLGGDQVTVEVQILYRVVDLYA